MAASASRRRAEEESSTRERLLDVALMAFAELGFDGASTRIIAARAGVNQGLIPYYFGTKEALWREAVDRAFAALRAVFAQVQAEPLEDAERLERLIRRFVRFVARRPEFARLMSEEGKRDGPRMRWIVDRHVRPLFEATQGLARGSRGLARPASAGGAAIHYYILVGAATQLFHQGPEFRRLTGLDPADDALIEAHADALVAIFVHGSAAL
jgi:AcrR family transcriptional regulator